MKILWSQESNGKLPHIFIPSKAANLVPEFVVEDLPLDRTATLVPTLELKAGTCINKRAYIPTGILKFDATDKKLKIEYYYSLII